LLDILSLELEERLDLCFNFSCVTTNY